VVNVEDFEDMEDDEVRVDDMLREEELEEIEVAMLLLLDLLELEDESCEVVGVRTC